MTVRPRSLARTAALVLLAAAAVPVATVASAHDTGDAHAGHGLSATHSRADGHGVVAQVRAAIAPYRDVDAALAAGYVPVSGCEESAEGAMGIHSMNPALAAPGPVDPAQPAILLYGPDGDGGLRLLGAEYWQPAVGQPTPTLAGRPFDGPMPGHAPGMPEHFDLHVWTEVANPSGVFAAWNPRVAC